MIILLQSICPFLKEIKLKKISSEGLLFQKLFDHNLIKIKIKKKLFL